MEVDNNSLAKLMTENLIHGEDEYVLMTGQSSRLYTRFNPPIEFAITSEGYEMALCRLETVYSFPNIDNSNNEICISIDNGVNWIHLKIPVGSYTVTEINDTIQRLLNENSKNDGKKKEETYIVLSGNKNTFKCELEIEKNSTIVNFNVENSMRSVLGFEAKQYRGGRKRYESENKINILRVKSILVQCDVIKASRVNGIPYPVIYNFFPDASPADMIIVQPQHLMYRPLTMNTISSMTALLTDQKGEILDLGGQHLTLTFHIRKRR